MIAVAAKHSEIFRIISAALTKWYDVIYMQTNFFSWIQIVRIVRRGSALLTREAISFQNPITQLRSYVATNSRIQF